MLHIYNIRYKLASAEGNDTWMVEFKKSLLKEYEEKLAMRVQEEAKIDTRALAALKKHERELSKPSPVQFYASM